MTSTFKVWVSIEEIDEVEEIYEDVGEPWAVGEFPTLQEAEDLRQKLSRYSDATAYRCTGCGAAFHKKDVLTNTFYGTLHCPSCTDTDLQVMPAAALDKGA